MSYFRSKWAGDCKDGEFSWRTHWSPPQKTFGFGISTALQEGTWFSQRSSGQSLCNHSPDTVPCSGTGCESSSPWDTPEIAAAALVGDQQWERQGQSSRGTGLLLFPGEVISYWVTPAKPEKSYSSSRKMYYFGLVIWLCCGGPVTEIWNVQSRQTP